MTYLSQWHSRNEAYLAAALKWLRLKLLQHIAVRYGVQAVPSIYTAPSQAEIEQAVADMAAISDSDLPPALMTLASLFGLSDFERSAVLLCAAPELDTQISTLCACAQDNASRPYPTFALILALFDAPVWDVVAAEHSLRYWQLIQVTLSSTQPLTASPLRVDGRIVNYIKGLNTLDERLMTFMMPLEAAEKIDLPPSQAETVEVISSHLKTHGRTTPVIQLVGSDPVSKQLVAQQVACRLGLQLCRLPIALLPTQTDELDGLSRLWQRESQLLPILLYLDGDMAVDSDASTMTSALYRFLLRSPILCFLSVCDVHHQMTTISFVIDVDKPTTAEQRILWTNLIGHKSPYSPPLLAEQFDLNVVTIQRIAQGALSVVASSAQQSGTETAIHHQLWATCLNQTRPQLDQLAQRLKPKATWDDIVLPSEDTDLLQQIAEQVRQRHQVYDTWGFQRRMNRGMGISALFAGESGTGKTMAAEVIANELQLNLYRIDLSAVVSKYIGETEKNLRRLFDAAEGGGTILLFDEADALFGKRSEVKDSHDRYANIEINYLLQRIEAYRGLAILATNLKQAIDTAFLRRLRFIVNFAFPGIRERQGIWQRAFPPETPTEDLDFTRLARFNLTGGNIHSIALNAAFLAAKAETAVTMSLVLAAIRTEFNKIDRPFSEADLRL